MNAAGLGREQGCGQLHKHTPQWDIVIDWGRKLHLFVFCLDVSTVSKELVDEAEMA